MDAPSSAFFNNEVSVWGRSVLLRIVWLSSGIARFRSKLHWHKELAHLDRL
jgi:hypothetical protein